MTTILEPELVLSAHARERMKEMGVNEAEVRSAIACPVEMSYSARHRSHIFVGRRISVCVDNNISADTPDADAQFVKTVVWSDREAAMFLSPARVQHLQAA